MFNGFSNPDASHQCMKFELQNLGTNTRFIEKAVKSFVKRENINVERC